MSVNVLEFPSVDSSRAQVEEAYGLWIGGLRRGLYRYGAPRARGLIGPGDFRQLVEEVADETFVLARHHRHRYQAEKAPVSWWLYMLGKKQMALELRRLERQLSVFQEVTGVLEVELLEPTRSRGGRELRQVLERDELARAWDVLTEDQAQALGLFYLYELSLEEVGKLLGKSAEAVSSTLQRARSKLRRVMGKGDMS